MGERGAELEPPGAATSADAKGPGPGLQVPPALKSHPILLPGALAAFWVVAATVLQLVRAPDRPPWTAIWAEDGNVFLTEALDRPFTTLFEPHSGYLQVAARAIGSLAALLPLDIAAATFAVAGSFVVAVLSIYVYFSSGSVLEARWARALMAVTFVFAPVTAFEVAANGLDVHWYLLFACFWALWSTSESTPAVIVDSVVAATATLSGPLTVLYAPLALRRARAGTGPRRWVVPGAYGAAIACQALALLFTASGGQRFVAFRLIDVPLGYALRVTGSVLVGDGFLASAWLRFGWSFVLVSLAIVGGVCIYGMARARGHKRAFICVALTYSGLMFAAALYLRGSAEMSPPPDSFNLNGSRYTVVPVLLVIAVLLVVAEGPAILGRVWIPRAVAVFVALVTLVNYRSIESVRIFAPDWGTTVQAARRQCEETGADRVHIPIAPGPADEWYVVASCGR